MPMGHGQPADSVLPLRPDVYKLHHIQLRTAGRSPSLLPGFCMGHAPVLLLSCTGLRAWWLGATPGCNTHHSPLSPSICSTWLKPSMASLGSSPSSMPATASPHDQKRPHIDSCTKFDAGSAPWSADLGPLRTPEPLLAFAVVVLVLNVHILFLLLLLGVLEAIICAGQQEAGLAGGPESLLPPTLRHPLPQHLNRPSISSSLILAALLEKEQGLCDLGFFQAPPTYTLQHSASIATSRSGAVGAQGVSEGDLTQRA